MERGVARPIGPQPGELLAGKYRVTGSLGRGGMGFVVAATNETTGKSVALKWVIDSGSEEASARFAREARAAGRIDHPNVVDVYDVITHDGAAGIVMERLHGESLAQAITREGRLSIGETVRIAIEVARGIDAAHAHGVVHRDLKPGNLFLCEGPSEARVKILDFGISKILSTSPDSGPELPLTQSGVVLGTPAYLAPEQVRSAKEADLRVDVYAMGAVLYEMLVGRPPHQNEHFPALLVEIATVAPKPVRALRREVSRELADIVERALAKEPDARFPTAAALLDALLELELPRSGEQRVSPVPEEAPTLDGPIAKRVIEPETAETVARPAPVVRPIAVAPARSSAVRFVPIALVLGALAALAAFATRTPEPTPREAPRVETPVAIEDTTPRITPPTSEEPPRIAAPTSPAPETPRPRARRPVASAPPSIEPEPAPVVPEPTTDVPSTTPEPRAGRLALDDL